MDMQRGFEIAAALLALPAAGCWFWSAWGELPGMVAYWDYTPSTDPFYRAVKLSARLSAIAALFASASALCGAIALFLK
jgi:hypothetical protein